MKTLANHRTARGGAAILGSLLALALLALPASGEPSRSVAITIDDLPFTGLGAGQLAPATHVAKRMITALRTHRAPAVAFVTGKSALVDGQIDPRLNLLRQWRDSGAELANHSFSHRSFHRLSIDEYLDDAVLGGLVPQRLMRERDGRVRYYRHPFNHAGSSVEAQRRFQQFLDRRELQLAPFTVEHADYVFERLYSTARAARDTAAAERLGAAYLAQLDIAFDFAEELARATFERDIPQVFLIHANRLNADYLRLMLDRLAVRGYRFISLEEALRDPAYATPTSYTGPAGISWLHRWRHHLGLADRLRDEPDPPGWVIDAYRAAKD